MNTPLSSDRHDLEYVVGRVLRIGIQATTACLILGLALALMGAGRPADLLLATGLVVLLATPVARVVVSVVDYVRDRDWLFALLTLVVLLQLAASLIAALIGSRA